MAAVESSVIAHGSAFDKDLFSSTKVVVKLEAEKEV